MRRVYLRSEGTHWGLKRATTGLMATAANGDWLDVVGVAMRDNIGVRVLRHRAVPLTLPANRRGEVACRRDIASAVPIGDAEIIDASRHSASGVGGGQNGSRSRERRRLSLSTPAWPGVIDVLVALSYPGVCVKPSPTATETRREGAARRRWVRSGEPRLWPHSLVSYGGTTARRTDTADGRGMATSGHVMGSTADGCGPPIVIIPPDGGSSGSTHGQV
jgi:hypothetical protein